MRFQRLSCITAVLTLAACGEITDPVGVDDIQPSFAMGGGAASSAMKVTGGGQYVIVLGDGTELTSKFAVSGRQTGEGNAAHGNFHHSTVFGGQAIDFKGTFTCLAIDEELGRAWIGGVITQNKSVAEPWASGEIYEPGRDIWFRVLDNGQPSEGVDRTTFVGFEGGGGIITSQDYCDARIWPDGDARTNALTSGNLKVH